MMKAKLKTSPTGVSVSEFIDGIEDEAKRTDCRELLNIMTRISGEEPVMWGSSIVGFGNYHYRYESGREADFFVIGFSPRKQNLTLYLSTGFAQFPHQMAHLGKHTTAKSCIYLKKMDDVNRVVLDELISLAWAKRRDIPGAVE